MKVLHVAPYYPPDRVGGVGEHVRVLHQGHLGMNVHSQVVTSGTSKSDPLVRRYGASPTGFALSSWKAIPLAGKCDLVVVHHGEGLLIPLLLRLRRRRPRIAAMYHVDVRRKFQAEGPHVVAGRRYGPGRIRHSLLRLLSIPKVAVDRFLWLLADGVVVETEHVRREIEDLRPVRQVVVIPHGLPPAPDASGEVDQADILFVGTPGVRKRTHLLPWILAGVRKAVPDARLRIVGFGPHDDRLLVEEARQAGVSDAIEFIGRVTSEEVRPHYAAATVLVLPSAYEGLPMVLLEAMRSGLPAVATEVSGHPDAVEHGVNGFLVPVDDVEAMVSRCVWLLENPEAAETMGIGASASIRDRFSVESELESHIAAYRRLLCR